MSNVSGNTQLIRSQVEKIKKKKISDVKAGLLMFLALMLPSPAVSTFDLLRRTTVPKAHPLISWHCCLRQQCLRPGLKSLQFRLTPQSQAYRSNSGAHHTLLPLSLVQPLRQQHKPAPIARFHLPVISILYSCRNYEIGNQVGRTCRIIAAL